MLILSPKRQVVLPSLSGSLNNEGQNLTVFSDRHNDVVNTEPEQYEK